MWFASERSKHGRSSILLSFVCISIFIFGLSAETSNAQVQGGWCATKSRPEQAKAALQRVTGGSESDQFIESTTRYAIPIAFHIVRTSAGTGGLDTALLDTTITCLNVEMDQVGVQFYQYGQPDFIDSDILFYSLGDDKSLRDFMLRINWVAEAMNLYCIPEECGFSFCGLSAYPNTPTEQAVIMRNDCLIHNDRTATLAHEVGHFFDLPHTHDQLPGGPIECPDGSNCAFAGDFICDTPADPYIGNHVSGPPECEYDHYADPPEDCDDTPFDPLTDNLMSYTHIDCYQTFTPQQIERFRYTIEYVRTNLSVTTGGLLAYPAALNLATVALGDMVDTALDLTWAVEGSVDIQAVTSSAGLVTIGGALPETISQGDTSEYTISFDASSLTDPCDQGIYYDTVVFTTTDPDNLEFRIPVTVTLGGTTASVESSGLSTTCLDVSLDNVASISDFVFSSEDALLEASLIVGLLDGADTVVYRNIFGVNRFAPFDLIAETDSSRSYELLSEDNRLRGRVTYAFDPTDPAKCEYVKVNYELCNPCDTALTILSGLIGDFDLGISTDNYAGFDDTLNMVYMTNSDDTKACGVALIDGDAQNLRAINVTTEVAGGFSDSAAYTHLESYTNADGSFAEDWAALLSLGESLLAPGDTARFAVALMYSATGSSGLADIYTKATYTNCCIPPTVGDVDQSGVVDITDVSVLIDNQFLTLAPLICDVEGDVDFSGVVDITDVSVLIDNQFISLTPLLPCP